MEIPVLSKILHVRENEKKTAQTAYYQSMDIFEEEATKLYNLLRKKEDAEEYYESFIHNKISIDTIKEQSAYIEHLNKKINELQKQVIQARNEMEIKQVKLSEAHIEVKKFEKMIENRKESEREEIKKAENNLMDEISMQQYLIVKNG